MAGAIGPSFTGLFCTKWNESILRYVGTGSAGLITLHPATAAITGTENNKFLNLICAINLDHVRLKRFFGFSYCVIRYEVRYGGSFF